jgi:RNA polymerase sigma-70 factor, ECF subfamily
MLVGEIATGGMATVHLARQTGAGGFARIIAVKRMHERFSRDPEFCAMFGSGSPIGTARTAPRIKSIRKRPYLVRIATNLACDRLRRRRREGYKGPFVPSPVDDDVLLEERAAIEPTPEARYDLMESASFAFMVALESLTAKARAVLVLRDVFDCSLDETAEATGLTVANVKVTHHRARKILEQRAPPPTSREHAGAALRALAHAIATGDLEGTKRLLRDDVVCLQDAGGEFVAAGVALSGRERVASVRYGIANKSAGPIARVELRPMNGTVAFVVESVPKRARYAARWVLACDVADDGRIARIYTVLATRKLTAVSAPCSE